MLAAEVDTTSRAKAQSQRGPGKPATMVPTYVKKDGKTFSFQVNSIPSHVLWFPFLCFVLLTS